MDRRSRITLLLCCLLPLPLLILGYIPCGRLRLFCDLVGVLSMFIFPYSLLSLVVYRNTHVVFIILALLQYPIYGYIWYAVKRKTGSGFMGWVLLGIHLIMAIVAFVIWAEMSGR